MKYRLLALILGAGWISNAAADSNVVMLGKLNLANTTFTKVVFFYDRAVKDIKTCEREMLYGRTGQWQFYGHHVKKAQGMAVNINYFCRESKYNISAWHPSASYDYIYQLDTRNDGLIAKQFDTYSQCLSDLRQQISDENHQFFCTRTSQTVTLPSRSGTDQ